MYGRKNKKLAHLMNAPGIGRSRSYKAEGKVPVQTRTFHSSEENNRGTNLASPPEANNSIKMSSSLLQVLQRNKACSFSPQCEDFGQHTSSNLKQGRAEYEKLLYEQYGFGLSPTSPIPQIVTTEETQISQDFGSTATPKKENSSQYVEPYTLPDRSTDEPSIFQGHWSYVDSADDVKQVLQMGKKKRVRPHKLPQVPSYKLIQGNLTGPSLTQDIHIGQEPRVKVIAEKYVKLKIHNIEVRKLEEQIVCLEYDVFDKNISMDVPIQTMRAYFSVFSGCEQCSDDCTLLNELAPEIRDKLKVDPNRLKNLKEKDIEIVNEKIDENRSYVSDLRRVLLRKEALYAKKKKSSLDLNYLYDMAKKESPSLDYDYSKTNLLSKKELHEVKKLILENREMPTNNISRKTIKNPKSFQDLNYEPKCRDEVIIMDLLSALEQK